MEQHEGIPQKRGSRDLVFRFVKERLNCTYLMINEKHGWSNGSYSLHDEAMNKYIIKHQSQNKDFVSERSFIQTDSFAGVSFDRKDFFLAVFFFSKVWLSIKNCLSFCAICAIGFH